MKVVIIAYQKNAWREEVPFGCVVTPKGEVIPSMHSQATEIEDRALAEMLVWKKWNSVRNSLRRNYIAGKFAKDYKNFKHLWKAYKKSTRFEIVEV